MKNELIRNKTAADFHRERATVFAVVAAGAPITPSIAHVLNRASSSELRAAARETTPVLDLDENATGGEVKAARRRRAVRHGRDVFLPSWKDSCTGLPNVLLRSALWSVTAVGTKVPEADAAAMLLKMPGHGDARLIACGPRLGSYDRRVFSSCLDLYRERPLSTKESVMAVQVSFFEFLKMMGVTYSTDSHKSLRASLQRLSALSLDVRSRGLEVKLPRLVEVSFADGEARGDRLLGSDCIYVRVMESIAEMFGPSSWTSTPHSALNAGKGLGSWLACYYQTHRGPYPEKLSKLHELSGSTCSQGEFNSRLKYALTEMCALDAPKEIGVAGVEWGIKEVTVHLARWNSWTRKPLPLSTVLQ